MKKKIVVILVCMLVFPTVVGAMPNINMKIKPLDKENTNMGYSHTILGEFGTWTTCVPCKYAHRALKNLYKGGWHPFYYITMVYDDNMYAKQRMENELDIDQTPTVFWDGGYREDAGATGVQEAMNRYNTSIIKCGERNVKDIDLSLDVEWLGAVNPDPENNETNVPIEDCMSWTVTAMDIDVTVDNNEASQYNGHLHVYVTEVNSTYWDDKFGDPYTFAFLDYAFNKDVTIDTGDTWTESYTWDGIYHHNGKGEYFDEIYQDNAMVIASVFDEDNNDYTDETAGFLAGVGTGPKTFDIYFGNTTPPPKVLSNTSIREYCPENDLEFNTTYYWKVDVWNNLGEPTYGDIWNFTTRDNNPPNTPSDPYPFNGSMNAPINTNLSWSCWDPDMDSVTYDVYFGDVYPPPKIPPGNQTSTTYDPSPNDNNLEFKRWYHWKIVAWDEYGYKAEGPDWHFRTQENLPPNKAKDPFPPHGKTDVPTTNVTLRWNGTDPNPGDKLEYDVYFANYYPPSKKSENQSENYWEIPYNLSIYKPYYWKIVSWDREGLSNESPIWNFTTGINDPPTAPIIDGPTHVRRGTYQYTFTATDPEEDDVKYYINWDDGNTEWTTFYASGKPVKVNHTWTKEGKYVIKAKARDTYGNDSNWSYLDVWVPVNYNSQSSQSSQSSQQQSSQMQSKQSKSLLFLQILEKLLNLRVN